MFTGIILGTAPLLGAETTATGKRFTLARSPFLTDVQLGASVSISGACLTVREIHDQTVAFDVIPETLQKTTLNMLRAGDLVNLERSLKQGDELGGHIVSGHVIATGSIISISQDTRGYGVTIQTTPEVMTYVFHKGFIALDGASLTIGDIDRTRNVFTVWLIPETLERTTFGVKKTGDFVNIEVDFRTQATVDALSTLLPQAVEHFLSSQKG
ncbi:riboflavin synthase subunit alpha [Patescibacteria group bacterium]|nr:riboflavin synthase subunit alpha [Patescibacteria group bacterium]